MKNVPNIITAIRIALVPFVYFFFLADTVFGGFIPYGKLVAILLFILAASTDWLDGMIARKYNVVSDIGKLLDPMADKILSFTGLVLIAIDGIVTNTLPVWAIAVTMFVILGRDFSVDTLRSVAATKGKVIAANWSGKIRTIVAMMAMPWLMVMCFNNGLTTPLITDTFKFVFDIIGYVLLGLAVVLCAYSWFFYFYDNRGVFKKEIEKKN